MDFFWMVYFDGQASSDQFTPVGCFIYIIIDIEENITQLYRDYSKP